MKYITIVDDKEYIIEIDHEGEITVNGEKYQIDFQELAEGGMLSLILNNRSVEAIVEERDDKWDVLVSGELYDVTVQDEWAYLLAQARQIASGVSGEAEILAPMPGIIVKIAVSAGDAVTMGQTIIILESMKMENELRSPFDGVVGRIAVSVGSAVEKNQVLAVVRSADADEEA